jgi:predicted amidohydrolase YtcJ
MTHRKLPRKDSGVGRAMVAVAWMALAAMPACSDERRSELAEAPVPGVTTAAAPATRAPGVTPDRAAAADVVFRQGRIFTSDRSRPWAIALAVKDGRIVVVGSNHDVKPWIGEGTRVFDLGLQFVMPAIVDPSGGATPAGGAERDLCPAHVWQELQGEVAAALATFDEAGRRTGPSPAPGEGGGGASHLVENLLLEWTIDNARKAGRGDEVGSLEVGKRADVLVLDRHPYFAAVESLHETKPVVVLSDGVIVRDDLGASPPPG